jgi:hypothetical protein
MDCQIGPYGNVHAAALDPAGDLPTGGVPEVLVVNVMPNNVLLPGPVIVEVKRLLAVRVRVPFAEQALRCFLNAFC